MANTDPVNYWGYKGGLGAVQPHLAKPEMKLKLIPSNQAIA